MRILVTFHVYYNDLASYYLQKLRSIHSCDWDLVVTYVELNEKVREEVLGLKPDAVFLKVSNTGYDVWPFIFAVKQTKLSRYDFVIKLHTKNEDGYSLVLNGKDIDGREWRTLLVEPMLGTPLRFARLMRIFLTRRNVGLVYNRQLGFRSKGVHHEDCGMLDAELARLGIVRRDSCFCAGTMFAVRACALAFLQSPNITEDCFERTGCSHSGSTMAHVYERLIPIAVQAQGYSYFPLFDSHSAAVRFTLKDVFTPMLEWLFSIAYRDDRKCVTVLGFRFFLSPAGS